MALAILASEAIWDMELGNQVGSHNEDLLEHLRVITGDGFAAKRGFCGSDGGGGEQDCDHGVLASETTGFDSLAEGFFGHGITLVRVFGLRSHRLAIK